MVDEASVKTAVLDINLLAGISNATIELQETDKIEAKGEQQSVSATGPWKQREMANQTIIATECRLICNSVRAATSYILSSCETTHSYANVLTRKPSIPLSKYSAGLGLPLEPQGLGPLEGLLRIPSYPSQHGYHLDNRKQELLVKNTMLDSLSKRLLLPVIELHIEN
ncbi:hypothetical protein STEG23_022776, partial [Scotinomys teguina]